MVHTRDLRHEPWRYRLRAFVSKPANLLLVFFLIVLVVLSLLPMATMLSNMFTVHVGTEKNCFACRSTPPRSGTSKSCSPGTNGARSTSGSPFGTR